MNLISVHTGDDGEEYVAVPASWVVQINNLVNELVANSTASVDVPSLDQQLQAAADLNRENAASRFPELFHGPSGRWYDPEGDIIVFTPYGYRKEHEVEKELGNG